MNSDNLLELPSAELLHELRSRALTYRAYAREPEIHVSSDSYTAARNRYYECFDAVLARAELILMKWYDR